MNTEKREEIKTMFEYDDEMFESVEEENAYWDARYEEWKLEHEAEIYFAPYDWSDD
jgi:hypothetical protein